MRLIHLIQVSKLQQIGQKKNFSKEKKCFFFDAEVTFKDGVLSTDQFVKPTETLNFRSNFLSSLSL